MAKQTGLAGGLGGAWWSGQVQWRVVSFGGASSCALVGADVSIQNFTQVSVSFSNVRGQKVSRNIANKKALPGSQFS